jgi:hypothetical protein
MSDNTAEVKITGDASGAVEAAAQAEEAVDASTGGIIAAFTAMAASTATSMAEFAAVVTEKSAEANESLASLNEGIESINKSFATLGAVLGGGVIGEEFMEMGKRAGEFGEQVSIASEKTGLSTTDIQGLGFAATEAGSSMADITTAMDRLALKLSETGDKSNTTSRAFQAMGISMAEVKGQSPAAVLDLIADRFANAADGANKTAVAMALFGRAGAQMIPLLNQGANALDAQNQKAQALGITLSGNTIATLKEMNEQFKEQQQVSSALWNTIGAQLAPAFMTLSRAFEASEQKGGQFARSMSAIGDVVIWATSLISTQIEGFQKLGTVLGALGAEFMAFTSGPKAMGAIWDQMNKDLSNQTKSWDKFREDLKKPMEVGPVEQSSDSGSKSGSIGSIGGNPAIVKSRMAMWESMLEVDKVGYEEQNNLRQMSKADEIDYWLGIINGEKTSAEEAAAIRKKVAELELEENKESLKQQLELKQEQVESTEKLGLDQIAADEAHAKAEYDNHKISADQLLAVDLEYELQRETLQLNALQARLNILAQDPTTNAAALQKIKDQMLQVEAQYNTKVQALHDNATKEDSKLWDTLSKNIAQSMGSSLKGLITGTMSWAQATENLLTGVLNVFIDIGEKMAEDWAAKQISSLMASKVTGVGEVTTNASVAASAAFASTAAIPITGPALAPEAAAQAYTSVLGFLPSAAGGFDIPAGINPLVQAHQREMILPADLAENVRNMTSGSGGNMQVHFNVTAIDANGVKKFFQRNNGSIVAALQRAVNTGGLSGATA